MTPASHLPQGPKILILGAVYETGNMGVDALLSGTIASILSADSRASIKALDYGYHAKAYDVPHQGQSISLELVNLRFSYKLHLPNNVFRLFALSIAHCCVPVRAFRRLLERTHPCLEEVATADYCVSLAGGDSFSDIYGMRRLWYVALPQIIVLLLRRPLVLLPQTLGPFKSGAAKRIAAFTMKRAQRVYSRDQESMEHARELLGERTSNIAFSRDMAFALEPVEPKGRLPDWLENRARPLVGLNVSGLLQMGGYSGDNMFGLSLDYPRLIEAIIRYFTIEQDADLVLVTHVTGAPGGLESDATACQRIFDTLSPQCGGKLHLADPSFNHREIKYLIGKCDFFLGARMHACIAALSQSVPAVGMAYSRKFKGVFETLEVPELVVDLRSETEEQALSNIKRLFTLRDSLAETLRHSSTLAKQDAYGIFKSIFDDAPNPTSGSIGPEIELTRGQTAPPPLR